MHRSRKMWLSIALVLLALTTGCAERTATPGASNEPTNNNGITVTDALGRTVSWEAPPERIVIAGKANFFLNDAVYLFPQAPERVVALTSAQQTTAPFLALLDPDYAEKVIFTPESTAEEIATAQPDVVLLKRFMRESVGEPLETLGIPVVYLDLETPEQYQRDISVLGAVFGAPKRAQDVWDIYEAKMAAVEEGLADLDPADRPTLLLLQYNSRGAEIALEVPPAGYIQTAMARIVQADTLWLNATSGGGWSVVNLEQIATWNPDKIVIISYFDPVDEVVARLTGDPNWQGLAAVQNGEVYGFPVEYYSWDQPDTRWILGLTWLAKTVHPEQFSDLDMGEEIFEFYSDLYGLGADTVEAEIFPLLQGDVTP